jgi:U4/U6 small nuclear ribonucleoprotein PRP31
MDVTLVDLDRLLPPATVMVVTVTATTTSGKPLNAEDIRCGLEERQGGCGQYTVVCMVHL